MVKKIPPSVLKYGLSLGVFSVLITVVLAFYSYDYKPNFTIPILIGLFITAWYGGRGPSILLISLLVIASAILRDAGPDASPAAAAAGLATAFVVLVFIAWLISGRKDARVRNDELRRQNELLLQSAGDGIIGVDSNGVCTFANPAAARMVGREVQEIVGNKMHDLLHHTRLDGTPYPPEECPVNASCRDGELRNVAGEVFWRKDGSSFNVEYTSTPIREKEKLIGAVTVFRDVTKQRSIEAALRSSEGRYRHLFENNPLPMWVYDSQTLSFLAVNQAAVRHYGYSRDEFLRMTLTDIRPPEDVPRFLERIAGPGGLTKTGEIWRHQKKDGTVIEVEVTSHDLDFDGRTSRLTLANDVTQRRSLEEQLRQSQKMEAVGMLAGGIAHDFNNLLTAINGYSDLVLRKLSPADPLRPSVAQILKAGERAAALTSQLLAFSRKQVLQPKIIDLNVIVGDVEVMLRRIIGENIELRTALDPEIGRTNADPGQIEQILLNLVVNARDAMPNGGKLTIETSNVSLDDDYQRRHIISSAGSYVMIAVSDNGTGMDAATQERIFEPFFSTKETGKGTGLGLSTTYGIVKQTGGDIWVYSEPGKGTTFKIYLPRTDEVLTYAAKRDEVLEASGGETLLLTEDEEFVRTLAAEVLETFGYTVLVAADGAEAIRLNESHPGKIDLLLTDVIMPGISGRDLAERIAAARPDIKVLYMSGYTDNAIVHHGVIDGDARFLQKPFSAETLASKVREVLDEASTKPLAEPQLR